MATTITVAGTDRTAYACDPTSGGALTFTEALTQRNVFNVSFRDTAGAWIPKRSQTVLFHHDTAGDLFGGYIANVKWRKIPGNGSTLFADCICVAYEQMLDRRRCWSHTYTNESFGAILVSIITNSLGGDGFTAALVSGGGQIVDGPMIERFDIQEPRPTIKAAIEQLCTLASGGTDIYYYDVTPGKVVRGFIQGTYAAPFSITDANLHGLLHSCQITETNDGKANRIFAYLGQYLGDPTTETLHGDGSTRAFNVTTVGRDGATVMPIGATPTITLNTVAIDPADIGIDGLDTGKRYYWNLGSTQIRQDAGETLLVLADDLAVTYQGLDKITLDAVNDSADIAAEAALQGGTSTGYWEAYIESNDPTGAAGGAALQQAYLDRVKTATLTFEGATYEAGLRAGQELDIDLASILPTRSLLIQSVTMTDQGAGRLLWSFQAIDGPARADWKKRLLGAGSSSGTIVASGGGAIGTGGAGANYSHTTAATADATITAPAAATDRAIWYEFVEQDSTGGWTITWDTGIELAPDINAGGGAGSRVNSDPNTMCIVTFTGRGGKWICTAAQLGVRIV